MKLRARHSRRRRRGRLSSRCTGRQGLPSKTRSPKVGSTQVTITVRKAAAFKVLMRASTQGRTRLFLLGKHAPKGGALIDTKTYHCDGAAGSYYCKGGYESLPAGTYTFRVVYAGTTPQPANIELTVRW